MEELLIIFIQFLVELVLNVLSNLSLDWPTIKRNKPEVENTAVYAVMWFFCGCVFAGFTLLFVKHSVISIPALRIANLILAPVISAFVYQTIASYRVRYNKFIIPVIISGKHFG